jgi:hypothetical protein
MRLRLHGTPAEVERGIERLTNTFEVVAISATYADRPPSQLVRVYLEIRLQPACHQP